MLATDSRDGNSAAQSSLMLIVIFSVKSTAAKAVQFFQDRKISKG
jgi:hypothetical protein